MKFKKAASIALAGAMAMSMMAVPAFADTTPTYSVKIDQNASDKGNHTYAAYKIFDGTLSSTGVLSDITWGSGVDQTALTDSVKSAIASALGIDSSDAGDAAKVAAALSGKNDDGTEAQSFASAISAALKTPEKTVTGTGDQTIAELTGGYYLIKDNSNPTGTPASQTRYLLRVLEDEEIHVKSSVPTVEKKVTDANDTTAATSTGDSADYDIGDTIPFTLTATLGDGIANYKQYYLKFTDTMSTGLTYTTGSATVTVDYDGDLKTTNDEVTLTGYDFTAGDATTLETADGTKDTVEATPYTLTINDLFTAEGITKANLKSGSKVIVTYNATLNNSAKIGAAGNPNEVTLTYSSNPNYEGDGTKTPTNETPKDRNVVFTYELDTTKYLGSTDGDKSTGAEFTLKKEMKDGTLQNVTLTKDTTNKLYSAKGIDDGKYILTETKAPDGYNLITDTVTYNGQTYANSVEITLDATHSDGDSPELKTLSSKVGGNAIVNGNLSTGVVTASIVDKAGNELPSTGGIGTKIFYEAGIAMIAAAGIILVLKKRKENA
jgi:fimbrial isopeptide formation D2 family protein/LPXTG-motif cell wall-anchored protein